MGNIIREHKPILERDDPQFSISKFIEKDLEETINTFEAVVKKGKKMKRIPSYSAIRLPLEERPKAPKEKTKWEKFAIKKQIPKKNNKKFRFKHGEDQQKERESFNKKKKP